METNLPADDQSPETPPIEAVAPAADVVVEHPSSAPAEDGAAAGNELMDLSLASQKARLAPADEERMSALLKEAMMSGRAGVARAVEMLPLAPWIVSVRSVEAVWKDLTAGFRTQLLAG